MYFSVDLQFSQVEALAAVEDQQPVFALALCTTCGIVEVLDPIQASFVGSRVIIDCRNTPVSREIALCIPVG